MGAINENLMHIRNLQIKLMENISDSHPNVTDEEAKDYIDKQISIRIFKKECTSVSDISIYENVISESQASLESNENYTKLYNAVRELVIKNVSLGMADT